MLKSHDMTGSQPTAWLLVALGCVAVVAAVVAAAIGFGTAASLVLGTSWLFLAAAWLDRAALARTRVEAREPDAEAQYRALLQSAPDAIVTVDAQGRIRLVNDEFEQLFGYAAREAIGQPVELLVPEALRDVHVAHRARFVAAPQRRPMAQEHRLVARRKDGSEFPVEISLSPLRSRGELLVVAVVRDVTLRRRNELERAELLAREQAALAQAEVARARIQAILESAPIGVVSVDTHGAQRLINVVAARLLCASCEGADSHTCSVGGLVHPGELSCADYEAAIAAALRGEAVVGAEARMQGPAGHPVVLELNAAPVRDLAGTVLGAVVTFQDVTARKDLERLREEYLSLISHDLRAPLSSITLQAGTLGRVLGRAGMGQEVHRVEAILRGSQRMNRMIQDLLDSARLESGHLELTLAPLDLGAFVVNTVEQALSPEERARVRVEPPAAPAYVCADRDRLDRVLLNLVSNALKYSPADRPVRIHVDSVGRAARLEVIDRGTGIAPEDQAHLFEKYFRARGTRAPGVGLGLYTARLLVEAHGGHLAAASTLGKGSTFTVTLPLVPQSLALTPETAVPRHNKVPPRTAS